MSRDRPPVSTTSVYERALLALACVLAAAPVAAQEDGGGALEIAGRQRTRYELLDPQYRAGFSNSDQALALQTTVTFDWRREGLQVFGEIMDARSLANDEGSFATGATTNALEPIQAFVALTRGAGTLRFGRFTQDLGKRRLVSRTRYRNTVDTFTGVDWLWRGERGRTLRVLYYVPSRLLPADLPSVLDNDVELDRGMRDTSLKGLFYELPPFADGSRLEAYVLDYERAAPSDPATAADHVSIGARVYRRPEPGKWNYEVEAVLQRGESGGTTGGVARADLDHRASLVHFEIGYQFDAAWSPNLMLQYDRATGDDDPTDARVGRFNTLLGDRRFDFGPTGIYGLAARSNLETPGLRVTLRPAPRWDAMLAYRLLRLEAARDSWVGSGWRDASGAAGRSIGRQLEWSFSWDAIPDRLDLEAGYVHVASGRFAKQTAGAEWRGDPRYYYLTLTTTF